MLLTCLAQVMKQHQANPDTRRTLRHSYVVLTWLLLEHGGRRPVCGELHGKRLQNSPHFTTAECLRRSFNKKMLYNL